MDYKIKKGDKYLCIKDYEMEDGSVDFTTAYQYKVKSVNKDEESVIFIDDDNDAHQISFKDLGKYFKPSSTLTQDSGTISVTNTKDNVNPDHYKQGKVECIDALESATVNKTGIEAVCTANVIKYIWRYESKNGIEDVSKALWYLNYLKKYLEEKNGK